MRMPIYYSGAFVTRGEEEYMFSRMNLKSIEEQLKGVGKDEIIEAIELLRQDERKTVQKLADKYEKQLRRAQAEIERVEKLKRYEKELIGKGYALVAGIDEAGRGPLAGPVVAAAVILPEDAFIEGINDSKKLSPQKRDLLFDEIKAKAISWGVGIVDSDEIDRINILNATIRAMRQAIVALDKKPDYLLIDALELNAIGIPQKGIIKGDANSISIAAASIIAKVTRDRMMLEYDKEFPGFGFSEHKGYGTREHYEAISNQGICSIHRKTFLKSII
ncbi:ribonuclease HII [Peptoclostridium sp.]|uniref:ribonuclease HII n=1 Tax=Peptoclostridium sp. TaxID=1904860 RepID=UPI002ECFEA24